MELQKAPIPAATIAEAFADAVPQSAYAPALLERAANLLWGINPQKSRAIRDKLKKRYPENPLSQK